MTTDHRDYAMDLFDCLRENETQRQVARSGLVEGRALRDTGMALTEAADQDGIDKEVIDRAIARLCLRPEPWSANELRFMCPDVRQPLIGARIRAAAKSGRIVHVSYTPSTLPSTHAHDIKAWRSP